MLTVTVSLTDIQEALNLKSLMYLYSHNFSRSQYEVTMKQTEEMDEFDIVTRSIDTVDKLWKRDMELQSRHGVRLSL